MVIVTTAALKAVGLFLAGLLSSLTDRFLAKPAWAQLEVLESTQLKTTGGIHEKHKAKSLWERSGAVVMVVRRPG
ncbi:unnamed protein product [Merluccius merluccius]